MPDTLVIVPTYNEREGLEAIVTRIRSAVPSAVVLIVDDASPDGTGQLADRLAANDRAVRVLHRGAKDGLGQAYLAGFAVATAEGFEYVVEMDADGSHDPAELPRMLELASEGVDLVIGSRWVPGGAVRNWPRVRQAISRTGNAYARTMLRSEIRDITSGFRVFRGQALRALTLDGISSQGYCFQIELAWRAERARLRVVEHPITFVERESGESKMRGRIVAEALVRVTGWGLSSRFGGRSTGGK
ncbi:MAG: polyprenol monophosphomannose synthase [Salinibacterium sp.]|nr:polyprenol monophosphomannose synthase [Salinibacterium sp.]